MNPTNHLIIYHANCCDGFTAAWVAHNALSLGVRPDYGDTVEMLAAQYGNSPPDATGAHVYIVDFSYPREQLVALSERAASLVVLDHHKTAADDLADLPFATFDMAESGASMAWDYFVGRHLSRPQARPPLVEYVRDRDLWLHEMDNTREINAWIRVHDFALHTWSRLAETLSTAAGRRVAVVAGRAIINGHEREGRSAAMAARTYVIGGVSVLATNMRPCSYMSEVAGSLAKASPAGVGAAWFQLQDGRFVWSLRGTPDVDVSALAKRMGGGGHPGAAAFTVAPDRHAALLATGQ